MSTLIMAQVVVPLKGQRGLNGNFIGADQIDENPDSGGRRRYRRAGKDNVHPGGPGIPIEAGTGAGDLTPVGLYAIDHA